MQRIIDRAGWAIAGALALALIATAANIVRGGPLDPTGAPAPTGTTLENIPGAWSRTLSSIDGSLGPNPPAGCNSSRFECVLGDAAVLDRETGLVWEREPSPVTGIWDLALRDCLDQTTGGVMGWRLATLEELRSLLRPTGVPAGHPFGGLPGTFWTSTTRTDPTTQAYVVNTGNAPATFSAIKATDARRAWCVRGGQAYDGAAP